MEKPKCRLCKEKNFSYKHIAFKHGAELRKYFANNRQKVKKHCEDNKIRFKKQNRKISYVAIYATKFDLSKGKVNPTHSDIVDKSNKNRKFSRKEGIFTSDKHTKIILLLALGYNTEHKLKEQGVKSSTLRKALKELKKGDFIRTITSQKSKKECFKYQFNWDRFIEEKVIGFLYNYFNDYKYTLERDAKSYGWVKAEKQRVFTNLLQFYKTARKKDNTKIKNLEKKIRWIKIFYRFFDKLVDQNGEIKKDALYTGYSDYDTIKQLFMLYFKTIMHKKVTKISINEVIQSYISSIGAYYQFRVLQPLKLSSRYGNGVYEQIYKQKCEDISHFLHLANIYDTTRTIDEDAYTPNKKLFGLSIASFGYMIKQLKHPQIDIVRQTKKKSNKQKQEALTILR